MTYYGAKDLADSLRTVRKNTLIIAEEIPEARYDFRAAPETRTVGQILTHIAVVQRMPEQIHAIERRTSLEGFDFPRLMQSIGAEEQTPRSKADHRASARRRGALGKVAGEPIRRISRGACKVPVRHDAAEQDPLRDAAG
jgi:hypothetical protein